MAIQQVIHRIVSHALRNDYLIIGENASQACLVLLIAPLAMSAFHLMLRHLEIQLLPWRGSRWYSERSVRCGIGGIWQCVW